VPILVVMSDRASRDEGLKRVSNLTRWIAGASIVVAGVFSAVAAKAAPGNSNRATQPSVQQPSQQPSQTDGTTSPTQASPAVTDNGSSQSNDGLVPPTLPPAPSRGSGSVSSGAS
jgi:hypothetical protein